MAYISGFGHLSNPYIVFNDANGKPLSNGTVETYIAGTTTAYNTLKDWNGTYNGAIITLDIYGGCTIIAPETQGLKLIVKTSTGAAYKTFDNVFIGGSNQGYLPGTTTIRVDGTDGEIISVGTPDPDDPDKLIFTISLDPAITTQINNNTTNIANLSDNVDNIDSTINTLIPGEKAARSFRLSLTNTRYLKILDVDSDGTIPYHLDFLLYLAKSQLSLKFDEDVQGLMGTGTGSFKYLGQSCNPVFVYDVTPNTGRLVIFRTTPVDGKVSFFLVSYNGYDLESETVSIIDGHISGTTAVFSADAYTEIAPVMAGNSETIYLTHNIRVGTSCTGLGTYYSPIEAKATQVKSSNKSVTVITSVTNGVTTHDLAISGEQGALSFVDIDSTNSPYSIPESVDEIIVSTTTADVVVTLPVTSLKRFYIKWILGTHNLTVNVADSGMIDGHSSFVFNTKFSVGTSVSFVCKESGDWIADGTITDGSTGDVSDNQNIWYLDTVNGLDTNSGLSRSAPKKTGDAVVIACKTAGKFAGRLVVMAGTGTVSFTAGNWVNTTFPFFNVVCESSWMSVEWKNVVCSSIIKIESGQHTFNTCTCNASQTLKVRQLTINGGTWSGQTDIDSETSLTANGMTCGGTTNIRTLNLSIHSALMLYGTVKIQTASIYGDGSIGSYGNMQVLLDIQTNSFSLEGFFQFPSQVDNSSIKVSISKMARTATTKLLYLGAIANKTVNYQLVVDTMGSIVPMEIANPAGTVAGKVIELLKYENKVDSEISRATAAEALKANKLTTVNNSTDTAYTFLASDANTCHIVNTSAATTRTVPSDSTAPDIAIGDSIEVQNLGTGVVTFVAASGVTIRSSLTLVMYGQYSVCMLRKIAANTWILTGERTAV